MVYNMAWLNRNYILPLKAILDEDNYVWLYTSACDWPWWPH
jgi:hypothetical protein